MDNNSWLELFSEEYGLVIKDQPVLLAERDGQRVFRVATQVGPALTLRLCTPARPYERVLAEAQTLLFLTNQQFPAPPLRLTLNGGPIFEWQAGSWGYAHDFIEGQNPSWNLDTLRELAKLLGRLHTLPYTAELTARVNWLDELGETISKVEILTSDPTWGRQAQEIATTLRNLPSLHTLPSGLIHTDPHEGNLLLTPTHDMYLLDWELAGQGQLLLDLALVLGWHCFWPATKGPLVEPGFDFDAEWCKTFLGIYQQYRPLTAEEIELLGPAIRFVLGFYAARDIALEVKQAGSSNELAWFHWSVLHSLTPARQEILKGWVVETQA